MTEENGVMCRTSCPKMCLSRCSQNGEQDEGSSSDDSLQDDGSSPKFIFPDEILAIIFSHLPLADRFRLSLVNKQWQRCAFLLMPKTVFLMRTAFSNIDVSVYDEWVHQIHYSNHRKTAARLKRFRRSKFGHVVFRLEDNSSSEELLPLMAEMAKSANTVEVFSMAIDVKYPPTLNGFHSLCRIVGPRITRLHFFTAVDITKISAGTLHDSVVNLRRLKTVISQVLDLLLPFRGKVPNDCFQQVEEVEIRDLHYDRPGTTTSWRGFVDRFQNQLRKLTIQANEWAIKHQEQDLLSDVRHFVRLEYFCLHHHTYSKYRLRLFVPVLRQLATACPRLTTFQLSWGGKCVALNAIKCLITAIGKIKQLKTVFLYLNLPLRQKCDEFWVLRMLREVAAAKNLCRDFKISHVELSNRYPVLQVHGSMGLDLSNKPFRRCASMEPEVDGRRRCKTYFI